MLDERTVRLNKAKEIKKLGINPYPAKGERTHTIREALEQFERLSEEQKDIKLVGRIKSIRAHGKAAFFDLEDESGRIQIYVKKDILDANTVWYKENASLKDGKGAVGEVTPYQFFKEFIDMGDFLEVQGSLFKTHKEEMTLMASSFRLLTKALVSIPTEWFGLKDEEERLRKRYLDILCNQEIKEMFYKRSKFWNAIREFLLEKGFLEVETPVLENTTGGADAKPFVTHHNAMDMDVYLRISMGELWQKRLLVAGYEKTFEIGRQFRNEGMDAEHLQDYTQMEFYWAYADYAKAMELVEEMYKFVAQKTFGTLQFKMRGFEVDLGKKWEKYDYTETVKKITGIDINSASLQEMENKLSDLKIKYDREGFNITRAIDNLWKYCRKQIGGPGFLVNLPLVVSPLAKKQEENGKLVQRFHPIIAGSELGNGYSELNDPQDQEERFLEQAKLREAGDEEAQMNDREFVEALEYGMPPAAGFGMSERVFAFFMDKPGRECQIFPLMKHKI